MHKNYQIYVHRTMKVYIGNDAVQNTPLLWVNDSAHNHAGRSSAHDSAHNHAGRSSAQPHLHKVQPENEVLDPGTERLEGGVGGRGPEPRHLVVEEGGVDPLQLLRHDHQTLDGLLDLPERVLRTTKT